MNLSRYLTYPHRGLATEAAVGALLNRGGARFLRRQLPPSVPELASVTKGLQVDAARLLADAPVGDGAFTPDALAGLRAEYEAVAADLQGRYESRKLPFPANWGIEAGTSFLLYALVRGLRPQVVIEMGVGNGQSSFLMLRALHANGTGKLYSFDIAPEAGALVGDEERERWELRLIDDANSTANLVAQLAELPEADICFHDADHGYLEQFYECQRLWEKLTAGGTLVVDDVDASYGLIDFVRLIGKQPEILIDGRKAIGVVSRASAALSADS